MKKICLVLLASFVLFCGLSCGKKLKTYTEINYVEYLEKINNNETFPLVIGSATCSACAVFKNTMDIFIKDYQVEVFFIDLSRVSEEEYNLLSSELTFDGTPTTVFIKDGKLTSYINRIDGAVRISNVKDIFRNNGYID